MKKKLLTLLLTICIICTLVPFGGLAEGETASGVCGTLTAWDLKSGTLTISGDGEVTSSPWLPDYADSITSIVVESGVTVLCDNAFKSCTKLTSVLLPKGIESIPEGAFSGCSSLTTVTLQSGLKNIGKSAFSGCEKLKTINLPDSVTSIGDEAFKGCASLETFSIPKSVTSIGKDAFSGCSGLNEIAYAGSKAQWNIIGYTFENAEIRIHYNLASFTDHYKSEKTEPTCTEQGYTTYFCSCGYTNKDDYVDALGHDTQLKNAKEATCTEGGYSGDKICKTCGETVEKGKNTSPLGHDYKDGKCTRCGAEAPAKQENPFVDVKDRSAYYYDPVFWAYYHKPQIANGMDKTHFVPNGDCTRAQIVTFLWRANGEPKATNYKNSFVDISKDDYYYNAVIWAIEKGITNGVDDTHFAPDKSCTRSEAVTFLWRAEGRPDASSASCPFKDVSKEAFYYYAMLWAVGKEITNGIDATHFAPANVCSRAQIVTFLYRDMA